MNPTALIAIGLGVIGALLVKTFVLDPGDMFLMQGGARFWKPAKADELRKALGALKATPHSQVADVWVLDPAGAESALDLAKKIQASGSVVATSPNLLDAHASPKTMAKVTAAQLMTFADKSAAILPAL